MINLRILINSSITKILITLEKCQPIFRKFLLSKIFSLYIKISILIIYKKMKLKKKHSI